MNADLNTITINGIEYIQKGSESAPIQNIGEKRIIVADRGWVFVGSCEDHEDGSVTIRNAFNIRRWGTTKGLGELANGPIPDSTKYDPCGVVRCMPLVQINVVTGW